MKNKLRLLLSLAGLAAVLALTGCDQTNNAVFKTTKVDTGTVQQDSVAINGQLVVVTPEMRSVIDPAKIVKAGTAITEDKVAPSPAAQVVVSAIKYLPVPYADVASYALNGLLVIAAAWLTKGKTTAEKTNISLVKGVDTFRDILDQTEVGKALDQHLTTTLANQQKEDGVQAIVHLLLDRYATPAKPPAAELTSAALKTAS